MTFRELERAMLAAFCAREVGTRGSLEQMRAVAICMRNRHRDGWHDGDWLQVIENADQFPSHLAGDLVKLDSMSRPFQRFVREIDEIYYSNALADADEVEDTLKKCVFWAYTDRPFSAWFRENVLDAPEQHPMRAQMGTMMFFE